MASNRKTTKTKTVKTAKRKTQKLSNNKQIELLRNEINNWEAKIKLTTNPMKKMYYLEKVIELRNRYTPLLLKKRPLLLTLVILLAYPTGIGLCVFLPFYIVRGKKRDINEEKIKEAKTTLYYLKKQYGATYNDIKTEIL